MHRRVPVLAVAMGVLLLPAAVAPVLGHVILVRSDPEAGATVSTVDTVSLVFDEALKAGVSSFKLVGPDGSTIGTGTPTAARRMTLGGLDLAPGEHTVRWAAAGGDGHIERGTFTFTVEKANATESPARQSPVPTPVASGSPAVLEQPDAARPTDGMAASGAATAPAAASGSLAPAPQAASAPGEAAAPASTSAADVLIPIVAGLVIVAVVGLLVLRRSRTA